MEVIPHDRSGIECRGLRNGEDTLNRMSGRGSTMITTREGSKGLRAGKGMLRAGREGRGRSHK